METINSAHGNSRSGAVRKLPISSIRNMRIFPGLTVVVLLSILAFTYISPPWHWTISSNQPLGMGVFQEAISLPPNLEDECIQKFDDLVLQGDIFYEESEAELVSHKGFQFEFRIIDMLQKKPVAPPNAPSRSQALGPFIEPNPKEIISKIGSSHWLLLNKYCMYRPMLVLPTMKYARQTDNLDISDLAATWAVLNAFRKPQMAIYNCGVKAGSSQGHKHLQVFPQPTTQGFTLWPSKATSSEDIAASIPGVPFKHFVLRTTRNATHEGVFEHYQRLLKESRSALHNADAGTDYNVVFTTEWVAVIPRASSGKDGVFGANAAGMVGMVSLRNQRERDWWAELGYSDYLSTLGIPQDASTDNRSE